MTQEEKDLLLKVLCVMLPQHDVVCECSYNKENGSSDRLKICSEGTLQLNVDVLGLFIKDEINLLPYLRPMHLITNEEFAYLQEHLPYDFTRIYSSKFNLIDDIHFGDSISIDDMLFLLDCLSKWHLDYYGLIPKGLALPAPEGMYEF